MRASSMDTEKQSESHFENGSTTGTEEWLRPTRLRFKPDFTVPETVLEEVELLEFTEEEERALKWKLDLRYVSTGYHSRRCLSQKHTSELSPWSS